ncbi:c9b34a40-38d1-45ab-92c4-bacae7016f91 [Thermothielavioides terrestris]|uniref:C9b34a40-38d1-45ab-92c4-bacae7016f91 n=1 Tax=Thermothielavioides terrestris TaxID=2587410 RepID=A0A3S4BER7_9PEZI|nr:c9b34a40-38d1-45ab-92c4-bacae7016f91 [Thermothielavioides terrestris]
MDNKRKASSAGAGFADGDDRAGKRQKLPGPPSDYNLMQGESYDGRLVASYFEDLVPRETNPEYYNRIRMPISLKIIEQKLRNQEFKNLSELESYFKRMVTNAKEFYPKNSEVFEDAERVRKALSNYMTKTNPAYKLNPRYSCQATPLPSDTQTAAEEARAPENGTDGAQGEDEKANGEEAAQGDEEDAEGDEGDEGEEGDEGGEEDDENPKRIILKRKGPGRPPRAGSEQARKFDKSGRVKADHEYEGVPYKGLSFQQAQEKIVEELIRKSDGSGPYFLDFINLPARTYKDYFAVITSPLSLKGLQKLVKGIHGRQPATGVSDFKSWAAFEEKASLLWTNAHFYNEEGSVIHSLATELKECFEKELNEAKAQVQEPPQPKIKLKMTPGQETPVVGSKKITIHVGGSRGLADSLMPSVVIRTHPSVVMDHRFRLEIPAHPKEAQQNLAIHIPGQHSRLQLIPRLAPFEQQGRSYRLFVTVNGQMVGRATPLPVADDPLPVNAVVFDLSLQHITNIIGITVIAALPKGQRLPNGSDCEVEKLVINAQLLRVYS